MMPAISLPIIKSLQASPSTGLIVLAVLLGVLVAKVLLQSAARLPDRHVIRIFDIVIWPLLVVFVIVVLERFRDLS